MAVKDRINVSKIGLVSTVLHTENVDARALSQASMQYGVAQAILDNIGTCEDNICVRNIYPSIDFGMKPQADSWKWIWPIVGPGEELEVDMIRCTYKDAYRDRSVLVIFGMCNLSLIRNQCYATRINFGRLVKTTEVIPLDQFENGYTWLSTPILYKKNDDVRITVTLNEHASLKTDFLKLIGYCIEPLGNVVYG